jgi:hypothetical protein
MTWLALPLRLNFSKSILAHPAATGLGKSLRIREEFYLFSYYLKLIEAVSYITAISEQMMIFKIL